MELRALAHAAATYVPGVGRLLAQKGTGGTDSAAYCYGVWMKHLVLLHAAGVEGMPATLVELGPGDSIGVGLAAILCGVQRYHGLDICARARPQENLAILEELVTLFARRAPRVTRGWPDYDAYLDERLFPSHVLTEDRLAYAMADDRLQRLRLLVSDPDNPGWPDLALRYSAPWSADVVEAGSADLILSHAVLQSVSDLPAVYAACTSWLKPGGVMSHQIDYTSFRTSRRWNGHWSYSEARWRFITGRRPYLINREPHSTHRRLLQQHGLEVIGEFKNYGQSGKGIPRSKLAARWRGLSDDDFACSGAFIQARKSIGAVEHR